LLVFLVLASTGGALVLAATVAGRTNKHIRGALACFSHFAVVLRSPRWLLRVAGARVLEPASVLRGLIGLWAVLGVVCVTLYQIENFALNRYVSLTTLQPGTTFGAGGGAVSTATALTSLWVEVAVGAGSVTSCASVTANASYGGVALDVVCSNPEVSGAAGAAGGASVVFSFGTSSASTSSGGPGVLAGPLVLSLCAPDGLAGQVVFAPVLAYNFSALAYDGTTYSLQQTVVPTVVPGPGSGSGAAANVLTGTTTVNLAAVPAQILAASGAGVGSPGYDFSYIATVVGQSEDGSPSLDALALAFDFAVPQYYLQSQQVEAISGLSFVAGIVALAGGVLAAATGLAFLVSYLRHAHDARRTASGSSLDADPTDASSSRNGTKMQDISSVV
jgi:hypothetical protein